MPQSLARGRAPQGCEEADVGVRQRAVLALDIGGTKLAVAVVTGNGRTRGFLTEPTRTEEGPDAVLRRLFDLAARSRELARTQGAAPPVSAVGISCGGPLDARNGVLLGPLHLPGWADVPIVDLAAAEFGVPAALENDASAAALAEYRFGAGRGTATMLYLTVSTGIGGGAVLNGRLHRGAAGNGGEYGHLTVDPGGPLCLCGRRGCLEILASGTSIARRAAEELAATEEPSALRALGTVRAEDVSAAAAAGDPLSTRIWAGTVAALVSAVTDLVNVFEPDVVVLGGGVTRSGALLLDPLRAGVLAAAMPPAAAAVRIELALLADLVGVVGAATVALDLAQEPARV
jgi:glucokinase